MSGDPLAGVLEAGRELGYLGPGPIDAHVRHAEALAELLGPFAGTFVDLGSGAGVPGLVLIGAWPEAHAVLIDSAQRRCQFLTEAADELGLTERVSVRCGRAEDLARTEDLRDSVPLVIARGFGPPPVVAECGTAFVQAGGRLVVTEPPLEPGRSVRDRWPEEGLASLGLHLSQELRADVAGAVVLLKAGATDAKWPRRVGVPGKRPLW